MTTTLPQLRPLRVLLTRGLLALAMAGGVAEAADPVKAAVGPLFNPSDFTSLGTLEVKANEAVTFDTGDADRAPTISGKLTATGAVGVSQSGKTTYAVFVFDSLDLGDKSKIVVTGQRPIVLISKTHLGVGGILSVSGANGSGGVTAAPLVGSLAGPSSKAGTRVQGGAGGGSGGKGGACSPNGDAAIESPLLGDPSLADVTGGVAGTAGIDATGKPVAGGGAGGGAMVLIALEKIFIAGGQLQAKGGDGEPGRIGGGGGGGGAIVLAAPVIWFRYGGTTWATGGAGASGGPGLAADLANKVAVAKSASGGGGGGGRFAIFTAEDLGQKGKDQVENAQIGYFALDVDGGNGGILAGDGGMGTVYDGTFPALK